uniref:Uncharacterized protein n=1 Tax=Cairina moschata TaxID=8855 RepID=A0A8C3BRG2_CAIMO
MGGWGKPHQGLLPSRRACRPCWPRPCCPCPGRTPLLLSWPCFSASLHAAFHHAFFSANTISKGFILVHLNIHDSLHFCSKRHLFI